ncbi:MAG TPA: diaminopimelate epimerase [Acidimicrobiia bacterium]|nr:diaminopimelate epimerase [Acidimicrobiia bacterium]
MRLHKLHATGNDFLVADAPGPPPAAVAALCDRHRGIGADGLMILGPGDAEVDCTMTLFNADGSPAEMSGNGVRCLAWVAVDAGLAHDDHLVVGTAAGTRTLDLDRDASTGALRSATVDMGRVTFDPAAIPLDAPSALDLEVGYHGVTYRGDAAGIGNPHLVLFVDDVEHARVTQHGPHLEHDPRFPNGTNVEFVHVSDPDELRMRVWERGVGETLSCGTGACAAAAAAHRRALVGTEVTVHVPGGDLSVHLGDTTRLGGPVRHVFHLDVEG